VELARTQQSGGGWSYVRLEGRGDNTIGFVTAAALCALHEAMGAEIKSPTGMINDATNALERLCQPHGSFRYMQGAGDKEAEGSLRGPLYALALCRHKKAGADHLQRALKVYFENHAYTRKERGKGLCHTGPEGFASYYLIFGYAFSAEALAEVPANAMSAKERKDLHDALLEDVMSMRLEDGSFCDNAMIGRHYGAGMALHVLAALKAP
jgi:hypothetical protein